VTEPERPIERPAAGSPPGTPLAAALALGRFHGIVTQEPVVLKDGSNVVVHLAPAPVVVRVATLTARIRRDPTPWLEREVALVTALAAAGAAVMRPSPLIPPGPHSVNGWQMTAWEYLDHEPGVAPGAPATLAALDELHRIMAAIPEPPSLPVLVPAAVDLDVATAFAVRCGLLEAARAAALVTDRDATLEEVLGGTADRGLLHGDAFPRNSLITPNGIVWIDLEDCCSGPLVWDDATLLRRTRDPDVERVFVARHGRSLLDAAIRLRGLQEEVWNLIHDARREGRIPPAP
jgi:Ser/Thr protein kinase RdoA (MazF antagonist)